MEPTLREKTQIIWLSIWWYRCKKFFLGRDFLICVFVNWWTNKTTHLVAAVIVFSRSSHKCPSHTLCNLISWFRNNEVFLIVLIIFVCSYSYDISFWRPWHCIYNQPEGSPPCAQIKTWRPFPGNSLILNHICCVKCYLWEPQYECDVVVIYVIMRTCASLSITAWSVICGSRCITVWSVLCGMPQHYSG